MAISLQKGGNLSLTKEAGGTLTAITVGLGWDARTTTGDAFDLDASAIICAESGKARTDADFVFYGQLTSGDGNVRHTGDERTGETVGDDEQIEVNLAGLAADVDKVVFVASIYDAETRAQNFGQVRKAYIRVVADSTGTELARYDLTEDASMETAMLFGEIYRNGADWKMRAVGSGWASGLRGIATDFGLNVG